MMLDTIATLMIMRSGAYILSHMADARGGLYKVNDIKIRDRSIKEKMNLADSVALYEIIE